MSGVEAVGLISGSITILESIGKLYDGIQRAKDALPAFRTVAQQLPLAHEILRTVERHISESNPDDETCKALKTISIPCKEKCTRLETIFQILAAKPDASRLQRYYSAVRQMGVENRVEVLMRDILKDVQLIAGNHAIHAATEEQLSQVAKAIQQLADVPSSLPQEKSHHKYVNKGPGPQNVNSGEGRQNNNFGQGKQYNAEKMYFESDVNDRMATLREECKNEAMLTDPRDDKANTISEFGERVEGTCSWIKQNKTYQAWHQQQSSQLLWICGPPATGKTYMSIFLTDELEREIKKGALKETEPDLLTFYFCSAQNDKRSTGVALLRGLIHMMLLQQPNLVDHMLDDFARFKPHDGLFAPPNRETLWRNFEKILLKIDSKRVYFVLDALDEYEQNSLEWLLQKLTGLFSSNTQLQMPILKVIITSRRLPEVLPVYLSKFPHVNVNSGEKYLECDLKLFISSKIHSLADAKSSIETNGKKRAALREKWLSATQPLTCYTNETFLWISFIIRDLRKTLLSEVAQMLDKVPRGLDNYYEKILCQISELGEAKSRTAATIIQWVTMAKRPLSLSELSAATGTLPTQNASQEDVMNDHIGLCGYFLKVDNGIVNLIHQSAKDYLRSNHLKKTEHPLNLFHIVDTDVHFQIAQTCLEYLQGKPEKNGPFENGREYILGLDLIPSGFHTTRNISAPFPLLLYAASWWPEHARLSKKENLLLDLSPSFFATGSSIRQAWIRTYWLEYMLGWQLPGISFNVIHISAFFGLEMIVESIVSSKDLSKQMLYETVNSKSVGDMSPLHWAVRNGHYSVAELLIVHGADVNARGYGLPPLIWAVRNDHKDIAKLLLDNNAEVDRMEFGLTALHWASIEGQEAMVRLLLDQGADTTIRTLSEYIAPSDKLQRVWSYAFAFLYISDKNLMAERDLRYLGRILDFLAPPLRYDNDQHGEPLCLLPPVPVIVRSEELLYSNISRTLLAYLARSTTLLFAIMSLNPNAPSYMRQSPSLNFVMAFVMLAQRWMRNKNQSFAVVFLRPMTFDILLGNYISVATTLFLNWMIVPMDPLIFFGLFTAFACIISYSTRGRVYKGRSRRFNIICSVMISFPLSYVFINYSNILFCAFTMVFFPVSVIEVWKAWPHGRTPAQLAAFQGFTSVSRLLEVDDEASLYEPEPSSSTLWLAGFLYHLLLTLFHRR